MGVKIIHRLDIGTPEDLYNQLLGLLAGEVSFGWEEIPLNNGDTIFRIHCEEPAFLHRLQQQASNICKNLNFDETSFEDIPWHESWKEFFTPVPCGSRYVIVPPWLADVPHEQWKKIVIEPECAFGTGHHATTTLCLGRLGALLDKGRLKPGDIFLDLGCGSGVLGIGAALGGLAGLGVDTDELAINNASKNRDINRAYGLDLAYGSIEHAKEGEYDLIMANILARPLMEMAPAIVTALAPGGALLLSGILGIQAEAVEQTYISLGLPAPRKFEDGEWVCLQWT